MSQRGPYQRRAKYAAVPTVVNGFRFASKAEARRFQELLLLGMAGQIRNLELQPRFPLVVDGERIAVYVGDFRYDEMIYGPAYDSRRDVVEDVKGMRTPVYILKRKLFQAQHPSITFREVR